jgi:REP element-mobilizing transposase RayT
MSALAYFITFTTYGGWLHGRASGSVDRAHNVPGTPFLPPDESLEREMRAAMRQDPYMLDELRRQVALRTIKEVAAYRKWKLWAAHVRSNHVHVVIAADCKPEKVMADLKAWCSRRLREACNESSARDRWTQHGSTRYLNDEKSLESAVTYVIDEQGEPMAVFDGRVNEPEVSDGAPPKTRRLRFRLVDYFMPFPASTSVSTVTSGTDQWTIGQLTA